MSTSEEQAKAIVDLEYNGELPKEYREIVSDFENGKISDLEFVKRISELK